MENSKNRPVAIKVSGVKKMYKLGQIGGGTLQADLQSWWAKVRGKEDPNSKIGEGERSHGKTFMALNGIDLTIYQGEAVGIIGSNGAGKSTLLKLLSKVTAPTDGEIDIYGRIASMLEVGTGFNGEMTGRENVYMNGAILGMTKQEIDAKMEEIIEFSEVREFIDTPVKRYSSGMFVKLAFSVAAHLDSEIMIMDEVLAVGDMAFQKKCLDKMKEAAKQDGRTVLYVSHNMNTIRQLCDRCIVLDKGKVKYEGDVEEAIQLYSGENSSVRRYYDCKTIPRESICDNNVLINYIEILYGDKLIVRDNENIRVRICFDLEIGEAFLSFRTIVFSSQQVPVGMAYAESKIWAHQGNNEIVLSYNFDSLAPGEYSMRFVVYEVNEYGGELLHDVIHNAFSIKKVKTKGINGTNTVWKQAVWGNVEFPDIEVVYNESN